MTPRVRGGDVHLYARRRMRFSSEPERFGAMRGRIVHAQDRVAALAATPLDSAASERSEPAVAGGTELLRGEIAGDQEQVRDALAEAMPATNLEQTAR